MTVTLRMGGAQLPCTKDLKTNTKLIKDAITWASENSVHYLVTPECALTGYIPDFDTYDGRTFEDIQEAETEIVEYAASKKVGLCLGTMWIEDDMFRRNQIRFYNSSGEIFGVTNKILVPWYEQVTPDEEINLITLPIPDTDISVRVLGSICNDLWGEGIHPNALTNQGHARAAQLIIHCTNGRRGNDPHQEEIMNAWHDAHFRVISLSLIPGIITVDNCNKDRGEEHHGPTSSESGALLHGDWKTQVPRIDTQYFFYDFKFNGPYIA